MARESLMLQWTATEFISKRTLVEGFCLHTELDSFKYAPDANCLDEAVTRIVHILNEHEDKDRMKKITLNIEFE